MQASCAARMIALAALGASSSLATRCSARRFRVPRCPGPLLLHDIRVHQRACPPAEEAIVQAVAKGIVVGERKASAVVELDGWIGTPGERIRDNAPVEQRET
ncbi:hypothetical protein FA95DRAFT_1567575 [Auriscalpium vulgare]|uniref:Uncharacterized protein n=1 Tax=Auriscalpium vulgare TaxID=40419 RepID=A0ACB8R416_9AGAM|nr:hypothetical protein FA95DRAFT_1567575 [Auriscalpium vulgare]